MILLFSVFVKQSLLSKENWLSLLNNNVGVVIISDEFMTLSFNIFVEQSLLSKENLLLLLNNDIEGSLIVTVGDNVASAFMILSFNVFVEQSLSSKENLSLLLLLCGNIDVYIIS